MVLFILEAVMKNIKLRRMLLAAMFLALGLLLPLLIGHMIPMGWTLLPMHIPVLLCGFICGPFWGLAVGVITPLLNSTITGMPALFPSAVAMAFELAAYGLLAGIFYRVLPKKIGFIYAALILAMLGGRLVWGGVSYVLYGFGETAFTWQAFLSGAVLMVWIGILIQIVLVPALMIALRKTKIVQEVSQNGNTGAAA